MIFTAHDRNTGIKVEGTFNLTKKGGISSKDNYYMGRIVNRAFYHATKQKNLTPWKPLKVNVEFEIRE